MIDRRTILKNSVAGGMAAALTPGSLLGSVTLEKSPSESVGYRKFQQLLGTRFMVVEKNGQLTQLELTSLLENPLDPRLEQFYLYFSNTVESSLAERSYSMHHPVIGDQNMFLQPLDQNSDGPHYRASFSLLKKA